MKTIYALALSALLAVPAFAGTVHNIPNEKPIATITFPKGWTVTDNDESIDAFSDDKEIYMNFELNDAGSIEGAIKETFAYLEKNKVEIDPKTQKEGEEEVNGLKASYLSWEGKDADGPSHVVLVFVPVTAEKLILVLSWGTPESEKAHNADLNAIMGSIKKK